GGKGGHGEQRMAVGDYDPVSGYHYEKDKFHIYYRVHQSQYSGYTQLQYRWNGIMVISANTSLPAGFVNDGMIYETGELMEHEKTETDEYSWYEVRRAVYDFGFTEGGEGSGGNLGGRGQGYSQTRSSGDYPTDGIVGGNFAGKGGTSGRGGTGGLYDEAGGPGEDGKPGAQGTLDNGTSTPGLPGELGTSGGA